LNQSADKNPGWRYAETCHSGRRGEASSTWRRDSNGRIPKL